MSTKKRKFTGSISVRIGTLRRRLELSPAELHGGEPGLFRVRIGRRWHNHADGGALFFDREGLAELAAGLAFGSLPELPAAPVLPRNTRASVTYWRGGRPHVEGVWTATPPIRGHDGRYYVGVMTVDAGFFFAPVCDITLLRR